MGKPAVAQTIVEYMKTWIFTFIKGHKNRELTPRYNYATKA